MNLHELGNLVAVVFTVATVFTALGVAEVVFDFLLGIPAKR